MFYLEKKYELAEPTLLGFIWLRIAMVLEFTLMTLPVVLLIVKVMEWTGDYLILAFFLSTALVKIIVMYIYPLLIRPLFSQFEELGDWTGNVFRDAITEEAKAAGLNATKDIKLEKSFQYDVNANASCSLGQISLGLPLFQVHKEHPAEIISVLIHECGHYKHNHLLKQTIVDTIYMVLFGTFLQQLTNDQSFLMSFGFFCPSYFASFFLLLWMWANSADVPIRVGLRLIIRSFERQADLYTVQRGYGSVFRNALIRSYAKSLDLLFLSPLDDLLNSSHPPLLERLAYVQA